VRAIRRTHDPRRYRRYDRRLGQVASDDRSGSDDRSIAYFEAAAGCPENDRMRSDEDVVTNDDPVRAA
jgi:hypothetical protein